MISRRQFHKTAAALCVLGVALGSPLAAAAPPIAEVEALQMPAWLIRDGKREPLAASAVLQNGDSIATGEGARVLLRLAEGSTVKLGENARFELSGMAMTRAGGTPQFAANMHVAQGAFRFTSTPKYDFRGTRNIDVKFSTVTASIVGTDLWGKSLSDRDIVALVEGKVKVQRRDETPIVMNQAQTVYEPTQDGAPAPISPITLARLTQFAQETELQNGAGTADKAGNWKVYAVRTTDQQEATAIYERLREAGYPANLQQGFVQGKQMYQVRIPGLLTEADGVATAIKLRTQLGLQDVRVALN